MVDVTVTSLPDVTQEAGRVFVVAVAGVWREPQLRPITSAEAAAAPAAASPATATPAPRSSLHRLEVGRLQHLGRDPDDSGMTSQ